MSVGPAIRRHVRLLFVLLPALTVLGVAVWLGLRFASDLQMQIGGELGSGQQGLGHALSLFQQANTSRHPSDLARAKVELAGAREHFTEARHLVDDNGGIRFFENIPLLGNYASARHRAVAAVADMGLALTSVGDNAVDLEGSFLQPNAGQPVGEAVVSMLSSSPPTVARIQNDLERAYAAATSVDVGLLPSGVRSDFLKARARIQVAKGSVAELQRLTPGLLDILGANGERTYLIEQVNPAELRSGGGFIGTVSVVTANHGSVALAFSGDVTNFDTPRLYAGQLGYVAPPHPLDSFTDFFGNKSWYFADSNFFPDFSENARWATYFADQMHRPHPNGVVALDFYAVQSLLQVTGPIAVPEYGITLDSKNFVNEMIQRDLLADPARKPILARVASLLLTRVVTLAADRWPALVSSLAVSQGNRHLQVSMENPVAERMLSDFGWYQSLNPSSARDFIMETEDNIGGSKANYFVNRQYSMTLTRHGNRLHHKLQVHIEDTGALGHDYTSAKPGSGGVYYSSYVRFYTAATATNRTLHLASPSPYQFQPIPDSTPKDVPAGYSVTDARFDIEPGSGTPGSIDLVVEYDSPWVSDKNGDHVMYWQKQPGTLRDKVDVVWVDGNRTFSASGDLETDRLVKLTPTGVGLEAAPTATAHLPQLAF